MNSKKYFEQVADHWDRMRKGFFSGKVRDVALATANVQKGCLAADIGAGTGFITEGLVKKGLKVVAVDQSKAMLEEMKKKFKLIEDIEYRIGESDNLPIQDETVDYVFSNMYLHHVEFPEVSIKEMARILKTGGRLIVTDLDEHNFEFLREEQHDFWLGFKRRDIQKWFEEAGLREVRISCVGEDCCAESEIAQAKACVNIFVASGIK